MSTAPSIDLSQAQVAPAPDLTAREQKAVAMLLQEVEKKARIRWLCGTELTARGGPTR